MDVFEQAVEKWGEYQIDMLLEESNELIVELGKINQMVLKLKRKTKVGIPLSPERLSRELRGHGRIMTDVADEIADVCIMLEQFSPLFFESVESHRDLKLDRLRLRLNQK